MKKFMLHRLFDLILASNDGFDWSERIKSIIKSIVMWSPIAFVMNGFDVWFKNNTMFFSFVVISIMANMILGGIMHFKKGSFDWCVFLIKTAKMCSVVIVSYLMLEMIVQIAGSENDIGSIFEKMLQISTLLYPIGKVLKNIYILSDGKHPPEWIMTRIYNFQKNGDLIEFMKGKHKEKLDIENEKLKKEVEH